MNSLALAHLLQLSSQALPVGGYSHSLGLESAIEQKIVNDEGTLLRWIADVLEFSMKTFEVPRMLSMAAAWKENDRAALESLNDDFLATRESAELRAAAVQMGVSLRALIYVLPNLPAEIVGALRSIREPSFACAWSAIATAWHIEPREAVVGYLWNWAENQVLVAMKAVPIGQSAGQRVLLATGSRIARLAEESVQSPVELFSNFAPALAILSAQHETQYSRLFRS